MKGLYQPAEGVDLATSKAAVWWERPRLRQSPVGCPHTEAQVWDGTAWVAVPVKDEQLSSGTEG